MPLMTLVGRSARGGNGAPNLGDQDVVEPPLYTLPRKENGDPIAWDSVLNKHAEDMWDFRTVPANAGTVHTVGTAAQFNTALTNCVRGDIIEVTAQSVLTGQFSLPSKSGTGWIIIRPVNYASLPAVGTRIATSDFPNMFTIRSITNNGVPLTVGNSASYWRIIGAKITNESGFANQDALVQMAQNNVAAPWSARATAPNNFVLDRCWIAGQAAGQRRGFSVAGFNIATVDCRYSGLLEPGADSQNVWYYSWMRRLHVENCYLGTATENIMGGGADQPTIDGSLADSWPADIVINRCEFTHEGSSATDVRKNFLETKNGSYVLVTGCVMHYWRQDNQDSPINILTINQGNTAGYRDYTLSNYITIRGNKIYDCAGYVFSLSRDNGSNVAVGTRYVEFSYNVIYDWNTGGTTKFFHAPSCEVCPEIAVYNNTVVLGISGHSYVHYDNGSGGTYSPDFGHRFYNNLLAYSTTYAFSGSLISGSPNALNTLFGTNNWRFDNNSSINAFEYATLGTGGTPTNSGNNTTRANVAAFQFTSTATDDYSLAGGAPDLANGSDGRARGCNWSTLVTNTTGVVTG